jgi:hypothetical protein
MATAADVTLDSTPGWVTIGGSILKSQTTDFMLDSPDRRKETTTPYRRALVHDFNDGLTINYNNDYPGGVTLNGVTLLNGASLNGASLNGVALNNVSAITPVNSIPATGNATPLVINGGIQFGWAPGGTVMVKAGNRYIPMPAPLKAVNLQSMLTDMQNQIDALTKRVAALEAK